MLYKALDNQITIVASFYPSKVIYMGVGDEMSAAQSHLFSSLLTHLVYPYVDFQLLYITRKLSAGRLVW